MFHGKIPRATKKLRYRVDSSAESGVPLVVDSLSQDEIGVDIRMHFNRLARCINLEAYLC
jgi:hypothetical protein